MNLAKLTKKEGILVLKKKKKRKNEIWLSDFNGMYIHLGLLDV